MKEGSSKTDTTNTAQNTMKGVQANTLELPYILYEKTNEQHERLCIA